MLEKVMLHARVLYQSKDFVLLQIKLFHLNNLQNKK